MTPMIHSRAFYPRVPAHIPLTGAPPENGPEAAGLVVKVHTIRADEQAIAKAQCEIHAMKAELDAVFQELRSLQERGGHVPRRHIQPVRDLVVMLQAAIEDKSKAVQDAETALPR